MDETELIRLFIEVAGVSESRAKCVVVYLDLLYGYYPRLSTEAGNGALNGQLDVDLTRDTPGRWSADPGQLLSAQQIKNPLHANPALDGHQAG
jgi:hypothetical protein